MKHQVFMLLFAYVDIDTIFAIIYGRRVSHFNITGEVSMSETNSSNIGFEKQIWDAACVCGVIWMPRNINLLFWA